MLKTFGLLFVIALTLTLAACEEEPEAIDVAVEGNEFAFTAPASVEAGLVTFNFKNTGQQSHEMAVARLQAGKTPADLQAAMQQGEAAVLPLLTFVGGANSVHAGGDFSSTSVLEPGTHTLWCFLPDPTDGVPHIAKGMIGFINVTGEADDDPLPAADQTIVMKDFTFEIPALKAGESTVRLTNQGPQLHVLTLMKLAEGKTAQDVGAFFAGQAPPGPPPFTDVGGSNLSVGEEANMHLNLESGNYLAVCPIPDATSGVPHMELGMIKEFTVD